MVYNDDDVETVLRAIAKASENKPFANRSDMVSLSAGFDHHGSAGYGCVKCDHKGAVSNRSKTVSDDIQPCGAGHPSCDRGSVESWKTGGTVVFKRYRCIDSVGQNAVVCSHPITVINSRTLLPNPL